MAPIAVVGIGCRFPGGSSNPEALWEVLINGKSCYSKVPSDRFNIDAFQHPSRKLNSAIAQGAHFISEDVTAFDASFFNIAPSDAKAMDPQQRMLLEVVYEGLESAGCQMEALAGSDTSCFVGTFTRDWADLLMRDPESAPKYSGTGMGSGMLANRVSWFFDWRGPSLTLDTACSSSLVAIHLACQSIHDGTSKVAVVCGTTLILNPDMPMWMSNMSFLSQDGLSKSFDQSADGYGRGEGIAAVILKSLDDAIRDGDCIRAVIRGSGVNQDGHTSGITLPSPTAQAELIESVYKKANLGYDDTAYFEAHGTGTSAGDAVEMMAIGKTITKNWSCRQKLFVGSIKSNVGHTEGAAGLAGFIKAVLVLEKGVIPPNIHLNTPSSKIPFDKFKVHVPTANIPWPSPGVRRASINSFGYGGTNAHVVIDDAASFLQDMGIEGGNHNTAALSRASSSCGSSDGPPSTDSGILIERDEEEYFDSAAAKPKRLFVLSAHDEAVMKRLKERFAAYVNNLTPKQDLVPWSRFFDRLAFTLCTKRTKLPWKSFVVADELGKLGENLESSSSRSVRSITKPRIAFVFTGQGAQWAGMGQELLCYPVFKESILTADDYLRENLGCSWSVVEELRRDAESSQLHLARFAQPICTILQIAIVDLLRSWGVEPLAVIGHSSGEVSAAVCAGALTREAGWKVAYWRGRLSSEMAIKYPNLRGSMLAAGCSAKRAEEFIHRVTAGKVQVACSNSPESVTISGDEAGIDEIDGILKENNLFSRKLRVENAYHSYHMTRIADEYLDKIVDCKTTTQAKFNTRMVSSVTGKALDLHRLDPSYWIYNLVSPVQFSDALTQLAKGEDRRRRRGGEATVDFLLEIGPHSALQGPIKQILTSGGFKNVHYDSLLKRGKDAAQTALEAAGNLFIHGLDIDVNAVNQANLESIGTPLVDLPTYPWNHSKSYWSESRISKAHRFRTHNRVDLLGAPVPDVVASDPAWRHFLRTSEAPWIRDHKIQSSILYPGAGMICMAIEAARQLADPTKIPREIDLHNVKFERSMIVPDGDSGIETKIQLLQPRNNSVLANWYEFRISSASEGGSLEMNCCGYISFNYENSSDFGLALDEDAALQTFRESLSVSEEVCQIPINSATFYKKMESLGLQYGPAFQNLVNIRRDENLARGSVVIHDTSTLMPFKYEDNHLLHPSTLDCMFQLVFPAVGTPSSSLDAAFIPYFIENLKVSTACPRVPGTEIPGIAHVSALGLTELTADVAFGDEQSGRSQVNISGMHCRKIGSSAGDHFSDQGLKSRYGLMEIVPDIRLSSTEALVTYLEDTHRGSRSLDEDHVLEQITHLITAAEPSASILEFTDGQTSVARNILQSFANARPDKISSTQWTIVDIDEEIQDALSGEFSKLGAKVSFDRTGNYTDIVGHITHQDGYHAIVIRNQDPGLIQGFLMQIRNCLRPKGSLLVTCSRSSLDQVQNSCKNAGFQRFHCFPLGLSDDILSSHVVVASEMDLHPGLQPQQPISLLLPERPSKQCLFLTMEIVRQLESQNLSVETSYLLQDPIGSAGNHCISLLEIDDFLPLDASSAHFNALRNLMLQSKRLIWVARNSEPHCGVALGLFRTVRNENPHLNLTSMLVDSNPLERIDDTARVIIHACSQDLEDSELILQSGLVHIPRYAPAASLDRSVADQLSKSSRESVQLGKISVPLELCISQPGMLETIFFGAEDVTRSDLKADELEVENCCIGITSEDVMGLMGQLLSPLIGRESSGIVKRVGTSVTNFAPGDRVYQMSPGSFKTNIHIKANQCQHLSKDMTLEAAASVPVAFTTALVCLRDLARLQAEETILIHDGADSIGQASIQLAKHYGASIFTTVRSESDAQMICETYGIPKNHIFNRHDATLAEGIKRATEGKGVDVLVNRLSGDLLRQNWHSVKQFGRFIDLSLKDSDAHASLDMAPFKKGLAFASFNIDLILSKCPERLRNLLQDIASLLGEGTIRPVSSIKEYTASDLEAALRFAQSDIHSGKVVVSLAKDDTVPVHPSVRNVLRLRPNAAYIIIGGLGGLGRSAALYMAECGAKHLAFLSRSGSSDRNAESLSTELAKRGAQAIFHSCDVADADQLRLVLEKYDGHDMPQVAGCIQGAMVLRDGIFENMTHEDFKTSLRPKVQGSWNLHQLLPKDIDFFVMMSSISGVTGNPGQANYAAGNTFMDNLAHYRRKQGLAATSIDLGLMLDVGFVAERQGASNLKKWESMGLSEAEFLLLMSAAMRGGVPTQAKDHLFEIPAQIVTGLATGGHVAAKSLDTPFYFEDARFKQLVTAEISLTAGSHEQTGESDILRTSLEASTSLTEASELIINAIKAKLSRAMELSVENVEASKPLHAYGVDSLMAVEIRNWLVKNMRCEISIFDVLGSPSILDMADKIARMSALVPKFTERDL